MNRNGCKCRAMPNVPANVKEETDLKLDFSVGLG